MRDIGNSELYDKGLMKVRGGADDDLHHHDYNTFVAAFGDPNPEEDTYADHVFDYIYNSENAPLRVGMRFVPPATCSYLAAVCCKVVDSTNGSILGMAAAGAPVVVFVAVAVPMSSYASKMLSVVTI